MTITHIRMVPYAGQQVERKFDNTKLVALNTCPTWGIIRYEHHRTYLSGNRAMALEAGGAAHQAFAAVRLCDLHWSGGEFYSGRYSPSLVQSICEQRSRQLFGEDRTNSMLRVLWEGEDKERAITLAALDILGSSGFYDDPGDRKRTIANIEESLIAYVSRYPLGQTLPVILPDDRYPGGYFVGVEIPINMYLEIDSDEGPTHRYNFTGRVDGVHFTDRKLSEIAVEENKTAARLDDAWRNAFITSHQPTGYCFAIGALLNVDVEHAVIRGMSIPIPKSFDYGGIVNEPILRNQDHFIRWAKWVVYTCETTKDYLETPHDAPQFTHSCNRYFRSCPLIPFCDSPDDERIAMLNEMQVQEWSPLEEGNG